MNEVFPSNYLKASDLNGKTVRVTIDGVRMEELGGEMKPILTFQGKDRGLVLNKTNWARIAELVGSDDSDDWSGWVVTLYSAKVDYQGKRVDAIRIDDRPGSSKPPTTSKVVDSDGPPPSDDDRVPF